jgi:hypothetical protein
VRGEFLIHERVIGKKNLIDWTIAADDEIEEFNSFIVHRLSERFREFRELISVNPAILTEAIKAEPLPEELGR